MKKLMTSAISLWVLIAITVSCAKNPNPVSPQANIQALSRSLFEPGATVPDNGSLVLLSDGATPSSVTTDGGFIAPPEQTGSGDAGSIAGPGTGDSSSGTGGSTPVTEVLPPASETGSSNSTENSTGSTAGDQANSGTNSGSTSGSTDSTSGGGETSGPGGNDGGVLNPPTGDQTADNGGISNGGTSGGDGGQSGGSSIDNVDPGAVVINETGDPIVQPGSTGGDSSPSDSSGNNTGSTGSSSETSSNDTGDISSGTTNGGADGGNTQSGNTNVVDNGGTSPVNPGTEDSGNGSSSGGTNVADGSSSGDTTGETTGNNTGSTGSSSETSSNDTGDISSGTTNGGADGGNTQSGNTNVVDNGGTSPVNPGTGDSGNGSSSGGTNVVDNGGTNPSVPTCPGANQPNSKPCGCVPQKPNNQFWFQLRRVCSINRSKGEGLFFEEAKNPIITIEHVTKSGNSSAYYAAMGYGKYPTQPKTVKGYTGRSLAYLSLKGVDLFKGPYKSKTTLMLENFKKAAGFWWFAKYVNVRVCEDSNNDGFCFDEPNKHQLAFEVPQFKSGQLPRSLQIEVWSGRHLTKSKNPNSCESQYSPLVLDLKGNGLDLIGPEKGVSFDLNDTGYPIRTGWIGAADDALLVRDLNGSRRIETGAELFGSATRLPSGARAVNGFEALRPLDSNNDGLITDRDLAWSELKLWIDSNKDGVSQRSELLSLNRAGVESIDLRYAEVLEVDAHGNQTRERSNFVRNVWGKRYVLTVSDVWFNTFSLD